MLTTISAAEAVERMRDVIDVHARRLGKSRRCVEDLKQEGAIGAILAGMRYVPTEGVPFEGYAYRRVVGRMLDYLRYRISDLTRNQLADGMTSVTLSMSHEMDNGMTLGDMTPGPDVWEKMERAEVARAVNIAVAQLPAPARKMLAGVKLKNVPLKEAAEIRRRAHQYLRERLAEVQP